VDELAEASVILLSTEPFDFSVNDAAAVKASMGSIFTVRLMKSRLSEFQTWALRCPDLSIFGSSDKGAEDYTLV
jgi:hypothetical protein